MCRSRGGNQRPVCRTCGVQGRCVESMDPNQGTETPSFKTHSREKAGHKSNEARVMSQTNCDESILDSKK